MAETESESVQATKPLLEIKLTIHNLHPYGSYQEDGSFRGKAVDVVVCALKMMDVELDLRVVPWSRAQHDVEFGVAHGFFAGSQNSQRDLYGTKSVTIADQKWQWYLHKDSHWKPETEMFKREARVSSFLGANMQTWLTKNQFNTTLLPHNTKDLAKMLVANRIDAALANNYAMDAVLAEDFPEVKVRRQVLRDKPLYVYFSKSFISRYPAFLNSFNQSASVCRSDHLSSE